LKIVGDNQDRINSHDKQIVLLQQQIQNLFDDNKKLTSINILLKEENQRLEKDNKQLREMIEKMKEELRLVQTELATQKEKLEIHEANNFAFDLADLFRFYFVLPKLKTTNWGAFAEELANKKAEVEDGAISPEELKNWLQPLQSEVPIDILTLSSMILDRNSDVHEDLRSATKQLAFIQKLKSHKFPNTFVNNSLVKQMLQLLDGIKLKRKC